MKGHIGGHFDRPTIADCRAESPGTEQLDSLLIQVRTVGMVDAYGADSAISTDRTVKHHIYLLTPAPRFWLRHHLPEGSAIGSTNLPHCGIWRRREKVRIERTFDLLLRLLKLHAQVGLLVGDVGWEVGVAIGKEIGIGNGLVVSVGPQHNPYLHIDADFIGVAFLPNDGVELNAMRRATVHLTVLDRTDNVRLIEPRSVGPIETGHATDFEGSLRPVPNVGNQASIDYDKKVEVSELIFITIGTRAMHDAGKPTALRPRRRERLEGNDLLVTGELMRCADGIGMLQQSHRLLANPNILRL